MIGETEFIGTARMHRDGSVTVKVTAFTPYGNREASVDQEVTDEKVISKVSSALEAAVKSVRVDLQMRAHTEAARAAVVAGDNKESIYDEK